MLSPKHVSVVILLIVCSLMVACGAPPPPPGEAPAGQAPGSEQGQRDQPPPTREQPTNTPTEASVTEAPPTAEPSVQEEPEQSPPDTPIAQEDLEQLPPDTPAAQEEPENGPDLAVAAQRLGITEQELRDALGPPPPDFTTAAQTLGITEQELQDALFPTEEADQPQAVATEPSQAQAVEATEATVATQSGNCADYVNSSSWDALDVTNNQIYMGSFMVEITNGTCVFTSNAIPNHNFNDAGGFANTVQEQRQSFTVTANPQKNATPTALSLQYDNAVLLNGVKVDLLAAGCYGVGNGFTGCVDMGTPWRYDPMSPHNDFRTDSHNAHTQPDGTYHYHGNPKALFDDSDGTTASPVIGFAADGFPIFGSYFNDNGTIRKALSSYQLRTGARPAGDGNPGGTYDGSFVDDYEYIEGSGDLDQCNGMTVDGVYGYYVTDSYPHILGCFSGTPHDSFRKRR